MRKTPDLILKKQPGSGSYNIIETESGYVLCKNIRTLNFTMRLYFIYKIAANDGQIPGIQIKRTKWHSKTAALV